METRRIETAGIRIGLQPGTRAFRIERNVATCACVTNDVPSFPYHTCPDPEMCEVGSWCIWINPSPDFQHGTYLKLYDDGRVENVTLHPEGHETVMSVKPADGDSNG